MPEWLIWIIGGVIVFELVEHAVLPLIWSVRQRRRGQADPLAALAGRRVKVAAWSRGQGQVMVGSERWLAQGPPDLTAAEEVVVLGNEGLVLFVDRLNRPRPDGQSPAN
jgi:membrane protein implicated in regulation of membrane protease activity